MQDNLEQGSSEEPISEADVFYSDAEPSEPTVLAEEVEVEDVESIEEESESEITNNDESREDDDEEGETLVFDKPNDFAKYEYDDDKGLYAFKSNGQKVEANIENLINNFQAGQKINIELEKIAQERKGIHSEATRREIESLQAENAKAQELTQKLEGLVKDTEEEINWDELAELDPSEYLKQKNLQEQRKDALEKSNQEKQQARTERMKVVESQEMEKLKAAIPEWKDEKVMLEEATSVHAHALESGFSQDELNVIKDHRFWLLMKADKELKAIKTKEVKEVKKLPTSTKVKRQQKPKSAERSAADIFYG